MKTLLLDCDGVLADTELYGHFPAFNYAFEEAGLPFRWELDEYRELVLIGGGKERIRQYFERHPEYRTGLTEADLDGLVARLHETKTQKYIETIESGKIPGRPGVRRLVDQATADGWTVAMASTSAVSSVKAVVNAVLTPNSIDGIFAGDSVKAKKPAPDIYLAAVSALRADPQQTVVIEDSNPGATAAFNAGLRHLVTVSALTRDAAFPHASLVVTSLGEPNEEPASVLAGPAELLHGSVVTMQTLEGILESA